MRADGKTGIRPRYAAQPPLAAPVRARAAGDAVGCPPLFLVRPLPGPRGRPQPASGRGAALRRRLPPGAPRRGGAPLRPGLGAGRGGLTLSQARWAGRRRERGARSLFQRERAVSAGKAPPPPLPPPPLRERLTGGGHVAAAKRLFATSMTGKMCDRRRAGGEGAALPPPSPLPRAGR